MMLTIFYDVLCMPSGHKIPMRLHSMVGLIPLFAVGVIEQEVIDKLPELWGKIERYRQQRPDLVALVSRWNEEGLKGRRLFALARIFRMTKILQRLLDETELLSPYGVRALSRCYLDDPYDFEYNGVHYRVKYLPGESDGALFGGNSNWRGPTSGCRSTICWSKTCGASISSMVMGSRSSVRLDQASC
jgi:hypothetical protein